MDWVDRPKNYKGLYAILQLLQGSHLDNFPQKTLKLGWVAFHSLTFQLKCLDFQSNQYKKLAPVLSRFCNGLLLATVCSHAWQNHVLPASQTSKFARPLGNVLVPLRNTWRKAKSAMLTGILSFADFRAVLNSKNRFLGRKPLRVLSNPVQFSPRPFQMLLFPFKFLPSETPAGRPLYSSKNIDLRFTIRQVRTPWFELTGIFKCGG